MYKLYSRYLRHIILPNFGFKSQDILIKSKILCVGAGGLGSPVITYLAMMGVGEIDVMDDDVVNESNLNRQFIFKEKDLYKNKAVCAGIYINKLNSNIKTTIYSKKLTHTNCLNILKKYDIILDCTDNLSSKFLINDCGIKLGIPIVHGAIFGFEGYVTIFHKNTLCYRCIYDNINVNECIDYGVFGPSAGIIGIIQASETIKLLLNKKHILKSKLFILNLNKLTFKIIELKKKKTCMIC